MHGSIRLFVDAALGLGAEIAVTPGQAHHLGAVMRRGVGDRINLFNGRDGEWVARITAIDRRGAHLAAEHHVRPQRAEPDCWLMFALLKRDATDLVVQKATELGVSELHPVLTERTNTARTNAARLGAIATEAAEQSERLTVPRIHPPRQLDAALAGWPAARSLFAAIERRSVAGRLGPCDPPCALLIGPEGGFAQRELDALAGLPFVRRVSLGPRILRAETAAIAGLALVQAQWRD